MSQLTINRKHKQTFDQAKAIAKQWQADGEKNWQLKCDYQQGENSDVLAFKRSGISGVLTVTATAFILEATLGFLLKPYQARIQTAIENNLDELIPESKT